MKKYLALAIALIFYASLLSPVAFSEPVKIKGENVNVGYGTTTVPLDNILSSVIDVRAFGAALTEVPINAAIAAMDNAAGGEVFIPAGTYTMSNVVQIISKNNVTVRGAGKGTTILDFTGTVNLTKPDGIGMIAEDSYGPITIFNGLDRDGTLYNITIKDLTIKSSTSATDSIYQKAWLTFGIVDGLTLANIEFDGGYREGVYTEITVDNDPASPRYAGSRNIRISNCYFKNNTSAWNTGSVDFNLLGAENIFITGNVFDNVNFGPVVLGRNAHIEGNILKDIVRVGIEFGESNTQYSASLNGAIIANNIFSGLGKNNTGNGSKGIELITLADYYGDNTMDKGNLIEGNVFVNNDVTYSIESILLTGPGLVKNNYQSGPGTYFIRISASGSNDTRVYVKNNILDNVVGPSNTQYGITITRTDNTTVYLGGNVIHATDSGVLFSGAGTTPTVVYDGDIIPGSTNGTAIDASTAYIFSTEPIFGSTATGVYTSRSIGTKVFTLDNSATPSIAKGRIFTTNVGQPTITNFTGGTTGQEITIYSADAATITDGGYLMLAGNWQPAGAYKTIRLLNVGDGYWFEISRSDN